MEQKNLTFDKIVELKFKVIKGNGIEFKVAKIDKTLHCVFGETNVLGTTSPFGFSVDELGIMGIQFDNSNGINPTDKKLFETLIKSIKHSSPYHYVPEENAEVK
ncbi:MAG: hypothetical protein HRT57_04360 [Crocinitomicaceae bacterium]|nr:hypothetical protein [Crocinitomicaceae bacterium]